LGFHDESPHPNHPTGPDASQFPWPLALFIHSSARSLPASSVHQNSADRRTRPSDVIDDASVPHKRKDGLWPVDVINFVIRVPTELT
jgi:hypothetical protein